MTTLDVCLTGFGALALALITLYGAKNYLITLVAGYIVFCIFYFRFGVPSFEWTLRSMLPNCKAAAIFYMAGFAISVIIYKIFPSGNAVGET
ncbi:hypothetical protein [Parafilimonas sp.]|uniref:hypothetical protein n=1 Tax=Parafilimonas sp. TaxID=1969739 RepID=UPI0039E6D386